MIRRSLVIAGLAALALGAVSDAALAQFYKGKTITMIINYPAGGPVGHRGTHHRPASARAPAGQTDDHHQECGRRRRRDRHQSARRSRAQRRNDGLLHPRHHRAAPEQSGAARQLRGFRDDRRRGKPAGGLCAQGHPARSQGRDRHHEDQGFQGALAQRPEQQHPQPGALARSSGPQVPGGPRLPWAQGGRNRDPAERGTVCEHVVAGLARLDRIEHGQHRHAAMADRRAREGRQLPAQPGASGSADVRRVLRFGERRQEAIRLHVRGPARQQRPAGRHVPHRHDAPEDAQPKP